MAHLSLRVFGAFLMLLLTMGVCCNGNGKDCPPPPHFDAQAQLDNMQAYRDAISELAGPDAVAVLAWSTAGVGEVWIKNCEDRLQGYSHCVSDSLPEGTVEVEQTALVNLEAQFVWERQASNEADFALKIAKNAVEAAFKDNRVQTLKMNIDLANPVLERLRSPAAVMNAYTDLAAPEIAGNVMVAAVVKSEVRLEYEALNEKGQSIELDLTVPMNEVAEAASIGGGYVRDVSTSSVVRIVQETANGPTAFAAVLRNFAPEDVDPQEINLQADLVCGGPGIPVTRLIGYDQETGRPIAAFDLEETVSSSVFGPDLEHREWFMRVENLSGDDLSFLKFTIRVRNIYGQSVGRLIGTEIDFPAGATADRGRLLDAPNTPGESRVELGLAQFDEVLVEYRVSPF